MSWVRIEDGFFRHRKVIDLSKDAKLLFIAGLCHCSDQTTDGFISTASLRLIAASVDVKPQVASLLVDVGLWHKQADGHTVHDYLDYQPSAEDERRRKAENADRVKRWRDARNASRNALPEPLQEPHDMHTERCTNALPDPEPDLKLSSRSYLHVDVGRESETENEKATGIAVRIEALIASAGVKPPPPAKTVGLVTHVAQHLDLASFDEAVGYLEMLKQSPRSLAYVAKALRTWATQRSVELPEWRAS